MVGDNVRYLREKERMTQYELGEKLGVSRAMVAQMERGTKSITAPILKELSDIFCTSIDELVKGDFASFRPTA